MENNVLNALPTASPVDRVVDRTLADRRETAASEIRRLVEAALSLIEQTGAIEPRVGQIVKVAGLSNKAFYKHFRSKRELLVAVLEEGVRILAGYLAHRMALVATPRERVREWLEGVLAQAIAPAGAEATRPFVLARGRLAESFPEEVSRSEAQLTELVSAAIAEGVHTGAFPNADPQRDAEALYHLTMGWVEARLLDPDTPPDVAEAADALVAFALAGLARGGE